MSARQLELRADELMKELDANARDFAKQGMRWTTLPRAELVRKLSGKTAHSPFLRQIGWGYAVRGSLVSQRSELPALHHECVRPRRVAGARLVVDGHHLK